MSSTFRCYVTDQRLTILDYDEDKSNVRYRAVINEDHLAVLHLQTVDIKDTPVSQLSLCPGLLESEAGESVSLNMLLIEKLEEEIVLR